MFRKCSPLEKLPQERKRQLAHPPAPPPGFMKTPRACFKLVRQEETEDQRELATSPSLQRLSAKEETIGILSLSSFHWKSTIPGPLTGGAGQGRARRWQTRSEVAGLQMEELEQDRSMSTMILKLVPESHPHWEAPGRVLKHPHSTEIPAALQMLKCT